MTSKQNQAIVAYAIIAILVNVALAAAQFAEHFRWGAIGIMVGINPIANLVLGALGAIGVYIADKEASRTRCLVMVALLTIVMIGSQFYIPYMLWTLLQSFTK